MLPKLTQLCVDLRPGEQISFVGHNIAVELLEKSGKVAKLRVAAPADVEIEREQAGVPRAMRDVMPA